MEMSVVDRINGWVMGFIRRKRGTPSGPLVCDGNGLTMMDEHHVVWTIPWSSVRRVLAFRYPAFAGDAVTLGFEADGSDSRAVAEGTPGWDDLLAALPSHLAGALGPEDWMVHLIAQGSDATMVIYQR